MTMIYYHWVILINISVDISLNLAAHNSYINGKSATTNINPATVQTSSELTLLLLVCTNIIMCVFVIDFLPPLTPSSLSLLLGQGMAVERILELVTNKQVYTEICMHLNLIKENCYRLMTWSNKN